MDPGTALKKRLPHIDLLKCLAIYFVLLFHGALYPLGIWPEMPPSMLVRYFSRTILSACVPLFFFASGYLMLSRPLDLKKHTLRTLKFLLLTCFWTVFLLLLLQPYYQEFFSLKELKGHIWDMRIGWNNHLWYLGVLIGIYLVLPVLKAAFDGNRASFFWFTAVMAVLVFGRNTIDLGMTLFNLFVKQEFYLYSTSFPLFSQYTPFTYTAALGLAYFCLGGTAWALEEYLLRIRALWRNGAAIVGIVLCCAVLGILGWRFSLYLKDLWDVVWNGYYTVFTLGNVLCLYLLSLNLKRDIPFLRLISSNTLGIYLVHDLLLKATGPVISEFDFMRTLPGTVVYATAMLLMTLAACLILRRIPLVRHVIS